MSRNSLLKRINIVSIQYLSYQNDTSIGTDVCPGRVMMMYHRVKIMCWQTKAVIEVHQPTAKKWYMKVEREGVRVKWVESGILYCEDLGDFQICFNSSLEKNHEKLKPPITATWKIKLLKEIKTFW